MTEEKKRSPGAFFVTVGVLIFAFVFFSRAMNISFGPITSFFEEYLIIPIAMIFTGRAMNRRARKNRDSDSPVAQPPAKAAKPRITPIDLEAWINEKLGQVQAPPPAQPRSATANPVPTPRPQPAASERPPVLAPVPQPARQPAPTPRSHPVPAGNTPPNTRASSKSVVYPITGRDAGDQAVRSVPQPTKPQTQRSNYAGFTPKTSAEMIAEAKKKLASKPAQGS